jgi:competence protein ComEA
MPDFVSFFRRLRAGEEPKLAVALLLAVALAAGLFWYRTGRGSSPPPAAAVSASDRRPPSDAAQPDLVVHVAGAVARPGLYRLPPGTRVADAIEAAGGGAPGADADRLNLAGKLVDGQRVAVPRQGEPAPPEAATSAGAEAPTVIDLNTATEAELDRLPGVGPATARAIVEERTRRGGFRSLRDLLRIRGIGERRLAELRSRLQV